MPKWFSETILIKYWEDRCHLYTLPSSGRKVKSAQRNPSFGAYPDISINLLSDNTTVPAEIEWVTTNFDRHGHNIKTLLDNDGFLIVFRSDAGAMVEQIEIIRDDFIKWFEQNAQELAAETLTEIDQQARKSREPQIFLYYVPRARRGRANLVIALEKGVWGFPANEKGKTRGWASISEVKKRDIVVVVHNFTADKAVNAKGGRLSSNKYQGEFEYIAGLVVTKGLYEDKNSQHWPDQLYPNRFDFRRPPLFVGHCVPCTKSALGPALHEVLRHLQVNGAFQKIDGSSMTKLMSLCTRYPPGDKVLPGLLNTGS